MDAYIKIAEKYIKEVLAVRKQKCELLPEPPYYPAIQALFDEVGRTCEPRVRCMTQLRNRGAGIPDIGFFEHESDDMALAAHGVVEVKAPDVPNSRTVKSDQVKRYFDRYRQVLVMNIWDLVLVGADANGRQTELERFSLAASEEEFWRRAEQPRKFAEEVGADLVAYLRRVLQAQIPIVSPEMVAELLAAYAREAKRRTKEEELAAMRDIKDALSEALDISDDHGALSQYFHSTFIQTLFYGIFSAWVIWARQPEPRSRFSWKNAAWDLHVPMISVLFEKISAPSRLGPLGIAEVLDWTERALDRVDRETFFEKFSEEDAVQYFYEPFLEKFDPELRREMGVWYTPREIVRYMVERTDRALREDLGIADGFADPGVCVLDPCCGTGAYLVEILHRIERTLAEKGADALTRSEIKRAAASRVFGFELLPAPLVVAHLQVGMLLKKMGVPLDAAKGERAGVYLANSLTGWTTRDGGTDFKYTEFLGERSASDDIKQNRPILVVIGNPPYNAFAGTSGDHVSDMLIDYKRGLQDEWKIKKFNLDDLYIRFFRLAEARIAKTGTGIVCFISNFSFISEPSFVVMRQHLLGTFDRLSFDDLNGDSRETGKRTPDGRPDPSVFASDIQVGTVISTLVRTGRGDAEQIVRYREFWGERKLEELVECVEGTYKGEYVYAVPKRENKFSFVPLDISDRYLSWTSVRDLCLADPCRGMQENRGFAMIDMDKEKMSDRMKLFFDSSVTHDDLTAIHEGLSAISKRDRLRMIDDRQGREDAAVIPYCLRPFDFQWAYHSTLPKLWNRSRPEFRKILFDGNQFLVTRPSKVARDEGVPFYLTSCAGDYHIIKDQAIFIPLLLPEADHSVPDLSDIAKRYLTKTLSKPIKKMSGDELTAIWHHALAIGYSPLYLAENSDGVATDWPRVPLPRDAERLMASAALGRQLAALLDVHGCPRSDRISVIGRISAVGGIDLDPSQGHLRLSANWGSGSKVVMPGKGKTVERGYTDSERAAIASAAQRYGMPESEIWDRIGETTLDVWLNDTAYWSCVPRRVYGSFIGGQQVIKKWLSYRDVRVLGRDMTIDEVRYVAEMASRLTAIRLMEHALDENYRSCAEG